MQFELERLFGSRICCGSTRDLLQLRKNNNPCTGLEQALHKHINLLANGALPVIYYDHGAIREVPDALALVFPFANNPQ